MKIEVSLVDVVVITFASVMILVTVVIVAIGVVAVYTLLNDVVRNAADFAFLVNADVTTMVLQYIHMRL